MAKFISVLNSELKKPYWKAIQWDDSLGSIDSNPFYSSDASMNLNKDQGDKLLKEKTVKEIITQITGTATVIQLAKETSDFIKLAKNKPSKTFIKKFIV
jgi:hypothetical protein